MPEAQGAAGSRKQTGIPDATGGATELSSAASSTGSTAGAGAEVGAGSAELVTDCNSTASAGSSRATCSFVSGPQRYDIAQRVVNRRGVEDFAETSRN